MKLGGKIGKKNTSSQAEDIIMAGKTMRVAPFVIRKQKPLIT
jgi:hypothetical protein